MRIKCDSTVLLYNRRFILISLVCIFLIYCAYIFSPCFSNSILRGTNYIGKILHPSINPQSDNEPDYPQSEPHLGPTPTGNRTRTCANELRDYSPSRGGDTVGNGNRHLPVALIIGVKKSGTRALLEFIRLHPSVRASGCEVHYFDRHYNKGLRWYRHRMPITKDGQLTMEKTPSYFITREVPKRVYNMNPKTKLILVVRDPVTRAISDYTQAFTKLMTTKKFEELAFVNGSVGGLVNIKWGPLKIGLYCRHLQRWLQYFHLAQFLFISGEHLISDPAKELNRVEDFLGLRPVITDKHFYFNATKGFPCIVRSPYKGRQVPHCLGKTKGRNHPLIDPIALDRLRQFYRPFNKRFYEMTGIDFGWL